MLRQLPRWLYALISPFLISPAQGAATPVFLASAPEMEGVSGGYYEKGKAKRSSPRSYDVDARKRLWELSDALVDGRASIGNAANTQTK
jgi:hypothetical protein